MAPKPITGRLSQANGRLKSARVGVRIEQHGFMLYLRATLPPKPGSHQSLPSQQRIALGIGAHSRGLQLAEREARKVGSLLDCNEFSWTPYLEDDKLDSAPGPTIASVVRQAEASYFQRRQRTPKSATTWSGDYLAVYRQLPQDAPIEAQTLIAAILTTKPDSKQRKRYCMALKALAGQVGIDLDTKPYVGNYSPKKVSPRDIPSDELIAEWRERIKSDGWRWVYGMCATFGLRPHEAFHVVEFKNEVIEIGNNTKTGARKVWACYPEWISEWNLRSISIPKITYRNNKEIGMRFNGYLNGNVDLPFEPYDLRHAWAIRTLEFGWPDSLAAQQMGHSVAVHTDLYHAWITEAHHQRTYDLLMARPDRPRPQSRQQHE